MTCLCWLEPRRLFLTTRMGRFAHEWFAQVRSTTSPPRLANFVHTYLNRGDFARGNGSVHSTRTYR
jgi:hypothetical protein